MDMGQENIADAGKRLANDIRVGRGRLLLFWPLILHKAADGKSMAEAISDHAHAIAGGPPGDRQSCWQRIDDTLDHIPPPFGEREDERVGRRGHAYAEALYFHEFVRTTLFRRPAPERETPPPIQLFQRRDLRHVRVAFQKQIGESLQRWDKTLDVERLNLYLFSTGVAVVVLEVHGEDWTLAAFQCFHDCFRRLYAPFFQDGVGAPRGFVPDGVSWLAEAGSSPPQVGGECPSWRAEDTIGDVDAMGDGSRQTPLFGHWRYLVAGALPLERRPGGDYWRSLSDERMPTMATVSLSSADGCDGRQALASVRDGDLMRLCFADGPEDDAYPYDRGFLARVWPNHVYYRFGDRGTLYLLSGYAFVAVGAGSDFDSYVSEHVRRHYFQMGLLLHFQHASLLSYSMRITRAVEALDGSGKHVAHDRNEQFRERMALIEGDFLQFVHRYRFTGISNQMQAREVFSLWRAQLELDALFDDVKDELRNANAFLSARTEEHQTAAANKLANVAAIGVVLGLASSTMGMNVVFDEKRFEDWNVASHIALAAAVAAFFCIAGLAGLRYLGLWQGRLKALFGILLVVFAATSLIAFAIRAHG